MKHRQFLLFVCMIAAFAINLQAQESENSLEDQFTDVIENSNRYQDYKVVKIFKLNALKKSVTDSLNALQNDLSSSNAKINELTQRIDSLQQEINKTETALGISKEKEDGIHLFGALCRPCKEAFDIPPPDSRAKGTILSDDTFIFIRLL